MLHERTVVVRYPAGPFEALVHVRGAGVAWAMNQEGGRDIILDAFKVDLHQLAFRWRWPAFLGCAERSTAPALLIVPCARTARKRMQPWLIMTRCACLA